MANNDKGYRRVAQLLALLGFMIPVLSLAADTPKEKSALYSSRKVTRLVLSEDTPLSAIVKLGAIAGMPFGIVEVDTRLCEHRVTQTFVNKPVGNILDQLTLPFDYEWNVHSGMVVIQPRSMRRLASQLLQLRIKRYAAPKGSLAEQNAYLWTAVRNYLNPTEGTITNVLSSPLAREYPEITLEDATVQDILDRLSERGPAAWIVFPTGNDIRDATQRPFSKIVPYSEQRHEIAVPCGMDK